MIHVTSPIRRPSGGLRRPGLNVRNKTVPKTSYSPPRDLVSDTLQAKLLDLDDYDQQDVTTEEILTFLQNKSLSVGGCLQMFLNTSWKDRQRKPLIAKVFHTVSQETDEDFASLIETQCNSLLNVLTLLGKPDVNDLGMVTLLVNLYNIEDLPEEHRAGVKMYLVDIAKAFWPYFIPDKHERVWSDDICDAVCDVLNAVGETLDERCPVNMERAFNNITMMLFTSSSISSYTLLRFLELKEFRASKWSLTNSARSYYKSAYLKHPRTSSSRSPEKSNSTGAHCNDINSPTMVKATACTYSSGSDSLGTYCNDVINPPTMVKATAYSSGSDSLGTHCNDINSPTMVKATAYSSSSDSPRSCSDSDLSNSPTDDKPYDSPTRSDSPSSVEDDVFDSPIECKASIQPLNDSPYIIRDANYEVTIKTNTLENGSKNAVVRVKELLVQSTEDKSAAAVNREYDNQYSNTMLAHPESLEGFETCNPSLVYPEERPSETVQSTVSSSTGISGNERDHPAHSLIDSGNFQKFSKYGGFPPHQLAQQSSTNWHENADTNTGPLSGGFGLPGQQKFHRFSIPEHNDLLSGGYPRTSHTFRRTYSVNEDTKWNNDDSEGQFMNKGGFPKRNDIFKRSQSENNSSYSDRHFLGFPRTALQRTLSETDSTRVGGNEGQLQKQYRSSYERQWRSMLEFPVEEVSEEDNNHSSRLYLLSFAVQPASMQRPSDLILSPELEEERFWLKDVVLPEPITVLDRFGSPNS